LYVVRAYMAAEAKTEPAAPAAAASLGLASGEPQQKKTVVVVAVDDSDHSYYALEWTVRHVVGGGGMAGGAADLVIVHAKPSPSSVVSFGGPGTSSPSSSPSPLGHLTSPFSVLLYARDRSTRSRRGDQVRGGRPAQDGGGRGRQGAPRLRRQLGARPHRGGGRGAPVRAVRRGGEAPRGPAGGGQPRLRRHQEGAAGERQQPLRAQLQVPRRRRQEARQQAAAGARRRESWLALRLES